MSNGSTPWVLTVDAVRYCIATLRESRVHPFFPAYLHLRQRAGAEGRLTGLAPRWASDLGPFLEVAGAPSTHPYFRPFSEAKGESRGEWLNPNLAGSYAGRSLRIGLPPRNVVNYDDDDRTFSLLENHWELAREHLLHGERLPLIALAGFFLRDFAIETDGEPPEIGALAYHFLVAFGYGGASTWEEEVDTLYDSTPPTEPETWFIEFEPPDDSSSEPEPAQENASEVSGST